MEKTVSSIVQDLLEKGHITAEEALVLLKAELNKPCCPTIPIAPYNPPSPWTNPYNPPFSPYVGDPNPGIPQVWYGTVSTGTGNANLNDNFTSK
jgi:hypothetical protein